MTDAVRVRRARVAIYGPVATGTLGVLLVVAGAVGFTLSQRASNEPASGPPLVAPAEAPATRGAFQLVGADANLYPLGDLRNPRLGTSNPGAKSAPPALPSPIVAATGASTGGAWLATADGHVYASLAPALGRARLAPDAARIVGIASSIGGSGYRLVAADGHVYAFGAQSRGPTPAPGAKFVGLATAHNDGYWLARADGAVVAVAAPKLGALELPAKAARVVGIAAAFDGRGYWLATSDGHVHAFGVPFEGDLSSRHRHARIVGIAPSGNAGYWLTAADGSVYAFNAPTFRPVRPTKPSAPIVAILPY